MAEEAAQAAALKGYEDALRAYEEQNDQYATGSAMASDYQLAQEEEAYYGVSMEEQARMMLMDGLQQQEQPIFGDTDGMTDSVEQQLQLLQFQQQQQQMDAMLMQEWMGFPGASDEATAQQLLTILEQRRQQQAAFPSEEAVQQRRPDRHYFTISQDGT
jgi:hypothetical protein